MAGKKIGIVLALDGEKQFTQGITNANKQIKLTESEVKKLAGEYEGNANSLEYLTKKQELLTKETESYEKKAKTAKAGLENSISVQKKAAARYEELKKSLEEARKEQEKMLASGKDGSKEFTEQSKKVEEYQKAVEKQGNECQKCEGKVLDWQKRVADAETGLTKANRALQQNEKYMKEAETSTDQCAKSINEFGEAAQDATDVTTGWFEKAAGAAVNKGVSMGVDALLEGVNAVRDAMFDASAASAQLAASTGLSEAAAARYKDVMERIKGDNYGEDYKDVADAMAQIIQVMGELDETTMTDVTESAITLRDTFGMDVNESIRAVDVMMQTMGVDATKAFDLIAKGAQNGLNRSGELTDNLTEYSSLWGQAGFSAEEMFGILENGLDAGAYNLDKVNDFVKEFAISLSDGRIEENLGSFSTGTQNLFYQWQNGEASTRDVFFSVISDLEGMTSQQDALTLASNTWSALGEDNAMQVLTSLNKVNEGYTNVQGTMDRLKETKFGDLESAIGNLGSAIQENFLAPIGDALSGPLTDLINGATTVVEGIGESLDPQKTQLEEFVEDAKKAQEELEASMDHADDLVSEAQVSAARLDMLGEQLISLNNVENLSTQQRYRLKQIVEELGESVPELADAYDEEAGKINLSDKAIKSLIESKKNLMLTQAMQNAMQGEANILAEKTITLEKAKIAQASATASRDFWDGLNQSLMSLNDMFQQSEITGEQVEEYNQRITEAQTSLKQAFDEGIISVDEYNTAMDALTQHSVADALEYCGQQTSHYTTTAGEATEAVEGLAKAQQEAQDEYNNLGDAVTNAMMVQKDLDTDVFIANNEKIGVSLGTWKDGLHAVALGTADVEDAMRDKAKADQEAIDNNRIMGSGMQETADAADTAAKSAEQLAEAQQNAAEAASRVASAQSTANSEIVSSYESAASSIKSALDFDPWSEFDGGDDLTVEEISKNLQGYLDGMNKMKENMSYVIETMGDDLSPAFVAMLEEMGTDAANTWDHMAITLRNQGEEAGTEGYELIKKMSQDYLAAMDIRDEIGDEMAANVAAVNAAMGLIGSSDLDFSALRNSISTAVNEATGAWAQLPEATRQELEQTINTVQQLGVKIPDGLTEGIKSGTIGPQEAIAQLNAGLEGQFDGLVQIAKEQGIEIPDQVSEGIRSGGQDAVESYTWLIDQLSGKMPQLQKAMTEGIQDGGTAKAVKDEMQSAADEAQKSSETITTAVAKAVSEAAQGVDTEGFTAVGEQIGEAIAEGIENKQEEISTALQNAMSPADSGTDDTAFEGMGEQVGNAIAEGIGKKGDAISDAISEVISPDNAGDGAGFVAVGEQIGSSIAEGISNKSEDAKTSGETISQAALDAVDEKKENFNTSGTHQGLEYAKGFLNTTGNAKSSGTTLAVNALSGAAGVGGFNGVGVNMALGVAQGISSGASYAISAAASMARQSLEAAKRALDIHSPSRKFRKDVGQQIGKGMAFGISDKASLAGKAAEKMSSNVYKKATNWLSKYKKSHRVSLDEEKWYWQQVEAHTKKGTTAYANAVKKVQTLTIRQSSGGLLSNGIAGKIAGNFGVSKTKTTGSGRSKKTTKKSDADYYSEVYSAAQKYISNQQVLNEWSLQKQTAYWTAVQKKLKKGTDAWYDATEKINDLKEQQKQAEKDRLTTQATVQNDMLDKYKVYYKVSAKAEADYWNAARKQFKSGTDERIEADRKYFEALQEIYDQRKQLDEDYAKNSKEINDQLRDDISDLQDAYKDAVKERKDDILSQMDLFEAWDSSGYDADTLIYNLKTQVAGLTLWEQQLEELEGKGLASGLLDELKEMGPNAAASIYSLNQMTAEQLDEYSKLWQQKNDLAQSQAVKDKEGLRQETNEQITKLRTDAQAELNALNADYRAAIAELYKGMDSDLGRLVSKAGTIGEDAVSGLIGGIKKAADSVDVYNSTTGVVKTVSAQLMALEKEGNIIGKNTLDGILEGMTDYTRITQTSKDLVQSIKRAMEEEAQIHSPSRLFRDEVGAQIAAGISSGLEEGQTIETARQLMQDTLQAAQDEMERQQENMAGIANGFDVSGIARLNRLIDRPVQNNTVVNIDNSGMIQIMTAMLAKMETMLDRMGNSQIVMDTGKLVGELQPAMSRAMAEETVRMNRGRMR